MKHLSEGEASLFSPNTKRGLLQELGSGLLVSAGTCLAHNQVSGILGLRATATTPMCVRGSSLSPLGSPLCYKAISLLCCVRAPSLSSEEKCLCLHLAFLHSLTAHTTQVALQRTRNGIFGQLFLVENGAFAGYPTHHCP